MKQVPNNLLSILQGHLPLQDDEFLHGFVSCLTYQYFGSDLCHFYTHSDQDISFKEQLKSFLDTQSFS